MKNLDNERKYWMRRCKDAERMNRAMERVFEAAISIGIFMLGLATLIMALNFWEVVR